MEVSPRAAQVSISKERVTVSGLEGFAEKSTFSGLPRTSTWKASASRRPPAARGSSSRSGFPGCERRCSRKSVAFGQADVALNRLALRFDRPAEAEFDAIVTPRRVSAAVKALPVPSVTGGSVRAARSRVLLRDLAGSLGIPRSAISTRRSSSEDAARRRRRGVRASSSRNGFLAADKLPSRRIASVSGQADVLNPGSRYASIGRRGRLQRRRDASKGERRSRPCRIGHGGRRSVQVGPQQLALKTRSRCSTHGRACPSVCLEGFLCSGRDCRRHGGREDRGWALERGAVPARLEPRTPLRSQRGALPGPRRGRASSRPIPASSSKAARCSR